MQHDNDDWLAGHAGEELELQREINERILTFWNSAISKATADAERDILGDFDVRIRVWSHRIARITSKPIAAAEPARSVVPDIKGLMQDLFQSVMTQLQRKHDIHISPALLANIPDIGTDAGTIDVEPGRADHNMDGPSIEITVGGDDNSVTNKRPSHSESDTSSGSKRPRLDIGNQDVYSLLSDSEDAIDPSDEVEGRDYIFRHHAAGPGWFVIRCDGDSARSGVMHRFDEHPFFRKRATNHFARKSPKGKCHAEDVQGDYSPQEIMRKFGYRVVDNEGNNVSNEWAAASNERLATTKKKGGAKSKPKPGPKANNKGKNKVQTVPSQKPMEDIYGAPARRGDLYAPHVSSEAGPLRIESGSRAALSSTSTAAQVPTADMGDKTANNGNEDDSDPFADDDDLLGYPVVSDVWSATGAPSTRPASRARRDGE
ncbi:hypothetical protein MMYC01_201565 [Madurella mycetomatis]|uniref:Uncharacterized protein n=1 Tax=Madurella mycetomatis TaxID=100816 RepID=A0A175WE76_9PEZI|nr:hypothetical protein MMYC01_201565 [Madurella mycetomatis]